MSNDVAYFNFEVLVYSVEVDAPRESSTIGYTPPLVIDVSPPRRYMYYTGSRERDALTSTESSLSLEESRVRPGIWDKYKRFFCDPIELYNEEAMESIFKGTNLTALD